MFSNIITNLSTNPQFSMSFPLFSSYFTIKKSAHFLIWKCALDPENVSQHYHQQWETHLLDIARLDILVFGLFICICVHILSFHNNPTNKVYILQKRPCHLDQNWWNYVEIFILVKIECWIFWSLDYLFVFVCIYRHVRIILQRRCTYCKKNHVIWTRIGGAM